MDNWLTFVQFKIGTCAAHIAFFCLQIAKFISFAAFEICLGIRQFLRLFPKEMCVGKLLLRRNCLNNVHVNFWISCSKWKKNLHFYTLSEQTPIIPIISNKSRHIATANWKILKSPQHFIANLISNWISKAELLMCKSVFSDSH